MPLHPRREVAALKPAEHGGVYQQNRTEFITSGLDPEKVLDFSICTNPFMPPPGTREIMVNVPIERYPDSNCTLLCQKLSLKLGIQPEYVIICSGTTELIRLIAQTFFQHRDRILIVGPTYSEYETATRLSGGIVKNYRANAKHVFTPKLEEIIALVNQHQPRAIFICNPNNPTGNYLSRNEIEAIAANLGDSLMVLDEAYVAFVEKSWNSLNLIKSGNVIILRSMTKDYGLPGLRLGYAVASPDIIANLKATAPPWNVNAVAQAVGITILEQEEYLQQSLRMVREASRFLISELSGLGLKVIPSDTHYFLIETGDGGATQRLLLKRGILIRDCTSFGLKEYIRVSPRTMPECIELLENFRDIMKK